MINLNIIFIFLLNSLIPNGLSCPVIEAPRSPALPTERGMSLLLRFKLFSYGVINRLSVGRVSICGYTRLLGYYYE